MDRKDIVPVLPATNEVPLDEFDDDYKKKSDGYGTTTADVLDIDEGTIEHYKAVEQLEDRIQAGTATEEVGRRVVFDNESLHF